MLMSAISLDTKYNDFLKAKEEVDDVTKKIMDVYKAIHDLEEVYKVITEKGLDKELKKVQKKFVKARTDWQKEVIKNSKK